MNQRNVLDTAMEKSPSWSRAHDWKSCRLLKGLEGSNPSFSARKVPDLARFGLNPVLFYSFGFVPVSPRFPLISKKHPKRFFKPETG